MLGVYSTRVWAAWCGMAWHLVGGWHRMCNECPGEREGRGEGQVWAPKKRSPLKQASCDRGVVFFFLKKKW